MQSRRYVGESVRQHACVRGRLSEAAGEGFLKWALWENVQYKQSADEITCFMINHCVRSVLQARESSLTPIMENRTPTCVFY